jgi:hypothetical protein
VSWLVRLAMLGLRLGGAALVEVLRPRTLLGVVVLLVLGAGGRRPNWGSAPAGCNPSRGCTAVAARGGLHQ